MKAKAKKISQKKFSTENSSSPSFSCRDNKSAEIRLGILKAEERVNKQRAKIMDNSPMTEEEKIYFN